MRLRHSHLSCRSFAMPTLAGKCGHLSPLSSQQLALLR